MFGDLGRAVNLLEARIVRANARRHVGHWQHQIDLPRRDGVVRHIGIRRFIWRLRDRQAAVLLDALEPRRSIGAGAGQDDANGTRAVRVGERAKKHVDRGTAMLALRDVR